uniref:SGNH hydrolase-type esterase domain-containing protein n=1 Tax=Callorhinchus milii TaxID=7868 RepID=A0A4W3IAW9_CALMI
MRSLELVSTRKPVRWKEKPPLTLGQTSGWLSSLGMRLLDRQTQSSATPTRRPKGFVASRGRGEDVLAGLEDNLKYEGKDPLVILHKGTNDIGRVGQDDLRREFEELGSKLKSRSSKVVISGLLPVPYNNWYRDKQIKDLNAWLKEWCRTQGFLFMGHWHEYWRKRELFQRNGLHLYWAGTNVIAKRINREINRNLN